MFATKQLNTKVSEKFMSLAVESDFIDWYDVGDNDVWQKTGSSIACLEMSKDLNNLSLNKAFLESNDNDEDDDWEILSDDSIENYDFIENDVQDLLQIQMKYSGDDVDKDLIINGDEVKKSFEFIEHEVLPSDTLQGICLTYKISATKLRMINRFSGSSLSLAPSILIIPINSKEIRDELIKEKNIKDFMISKLIDKVPGLTYSEARLLLESNQYDVQKASSKANLHIKTKSHLTKKRPDAMPQRFTLTVKNANEQPIHNKV